MRVSIYMLILAALLFIQCKEYNDIDRESIEQTVLTYENGELSKKISYDSKGNELERLVYLKDKVVGRYITFYDEQNNVIESRGTGKSGEVIHRVVKHYVGSKLMGGVNFNDDGDGLEYNLFYQDGVLEHKIYFSDELNLIVGLSSYEYDSLGNLASIEHLDFMYDEGVRKPDYVNIQRVEEFKYDRLNQKTYHIKYSPPEIYNYASEEYFDSNGNLIQYKRYSKGKVRTYEVYEFDSDNQMIKKVDSVSGAVYTYTYKVS